MGFSKFFKTRLQQEILEEKANLSKSWNVMIKQILREFNYAFIEIEAGVGLSKSNGNPYIWANIEMDYDMPDGFDVYEINGKKTFLKQSDLFMVTKKHVPRKQFFAYNEGDVILDKGDDIQVSKTKTFNDPDAFEAFVQKMSLYNEAHPEATKGMIEDFKKVISFKVMKSVKNKTVRGVDQETYLKS